MLQNFIIKHKVDVMSLTVTNTDWSKEPDEFTIWNAIRKWNSEARTYATYNQLNRNTNRKQYGGISLSLLGDTVHHK